MGQPDGFVKHGKNNKERVRRLHKALYDLRQSPRAWNGAIRKWLMSNGFVITTADPCLYMGVDLLVVLVLYVDDIRLSGRHGVVIEDTTNRRMLMGQFQKTDLGSVKVFVGIQVARESKSGIGTDNTMISQNICRYIAPFLERFAMKGCITAPPAYGAPLEKLDTDEKTDNQARCRHYREVVGCLQHPITRGLTSSTGFCSYRVTWRGRGR